MAGLSLLMASVVLCDESCPHQVRVLAWISMFSGCSSSCPRGYFYPLKYVHSLDPHQHSSR